MKGLRRDNKVLSDGKWNMLVKMVVSNYKANVGVRLWHRKPNREREKRNQDHFRLTGCFSPIVVSFH